MRALDQEVKDAVWAAVRARLPVREDSHPLGCHRRRAPDRLCFEGILNAVGDGLFLADRGAPVGLRGLGHDAAGTPRRMDRSRRVRRRGRRGAGGL